MKTKIIITESQYLRLKNSLINETKFSWDGKYANESDINEIGDDLELPIDEEDLGSLLNQPEPTDVKNSQWFSDVDGERSVDNIFN